MPSVPKRQHITQSEHQQPFPCVEPVAAHNPVQALRIGRELKRLNYCWLEELLFDVDLHCRSAISNREFFDLMLSLSYLEIDMKSKLVIHKDRPSSSGRTRV